MSRRFTALCVASIVSAAFWLPANASAVELTEPTGTKMAVSSLVTATTLSGGTFWNTAHSVRLAICTTSTWTGTLVSNTGVPQINWTNVTYGGTGPTPAGGVEPECTGEIGNSTFDTNVGNGVPWCMTFTSETTFSIRGNQCSSESRSMTFVITSTTAGSCKYNRSSAVTGTVTRDTGALPVDAVDHMSAEAGTEFTKEEGGFLCPAAGQLEMSFTLETDVNPSAIPIYVS